MPVIQHGAVSALDAYQFHGLIFSKENGKQATADCPWCGKENKFTVCLETGQWQCFVCGARGNIYSFLQQLWKKSDIATSEYADLRDDRALLYNDTLMNWGICRSILTNDWLVPSYNAQGKLIQLYRYVCGRLLATKGLGHGLFQSLDYKSTDKVYLCEGVWDGMVLWELLRNCKQTEQGLLPTANTSRSLLSNCSILATPGCNVFFNKWVDSFAKKQVIVLYDNDHPRNGQPAAGYAGVQRVNNLLANCAEIQYLCWGTGGYDPVLPSGYDLRDAITAGKESSNLQQRIDNWQKITAKIKPFVDSGTKKSFESKKNKSQLVCKKCTSYQALTQSWRKAMSWTNGLDHALATMLATTLSTKAVGDQLWLKVIGPAACGKSTLCEAISVAKNYVVAKSTIRGFHSGFREEGGSATGEDNSLIAQLYDKTLVTKDGDTLLQSPNLQQILSEARDLYDCTARTHYRNKMSKDYEGVRMTWILCGTSSLRSIDASELGERFLDCVIMEGIDDELEDEVLLRVVHKADRNLLIESNGDATSRYDPQLRDAMELTGGYINHLRENAPELLATIHNSNRAKQLIIRLGKFTAYMRARPSWRQDETAEREFASRLVSQLTRLAKCLAVVLNRQEVDEEVIRRVRQIAMDTGRGQTLEIVEYLTTRPEGIETYALTIGVDRSESGTKRMLHFLQKIDVVESFIPKVRNVRGRMRWRLTPKMRKLYKDVT